MKLNYEIDLNISDSRKTKILDVATKLIGKHGYANTSFQMIADELKLSQSAIIHHFPKKILLIKAIFYRIVLNVDAIVQSKLTPKNSGLERLDHYFLANVEWAKKFPNELSINIFLAYEASTQKDFAQILRDVRHNSINRIKEYLYAAKREKSIKIRDSEIDNLASLIHAQMTGVIIHLATSMKASRDSHWHLKQWKYFKATILK